MEDAIHGIRLAHDVMEAIRALSRDHRLEIRARIAVNRGEVRCRRDASGAIPSFEPDAVLLGNADHLVGAAAVGEILAGGGAFRLARREYNFGEERAITVAGESGDGGEPRRLKGYPVLRAKSRADRSREEPTRGRFLGREDELESLRRCRDRALGGAVTLVKVVGELGIGKSRLVSRFLGELEPDQGRAIKIECLFAERDSPLAGAAAALRAVLELGEIEVEPELLGEPMAGLLGGAPRYLARQQAFLGEFLRSPDRAWTRGRGRRRRLIRRVAYGLGVLVTQVAAADPLVLVVENAHWLDGQSVDVLAELAQTGVGQRLLVLLVGQPSTLAGRRIAGSVENLEVGELPEEVLRELIVERLGAGEEMEAIAEQVLPRAQGNPFFLGEIIDSLIDRGIIAPVESSSSAVRFRQAKPGAIRLPTTMEGLAAEHIDALDPPLRTTLRAAAAVGSSSSRA
jgi:hypothetical protein